MVESRPTLGSTTWWASHSAFGRLSDKKTLNQSLQVTVPSTYYGLRRPFSNTAANAKRRTSHGLDDTRSRRNLHRSRNQRLPAARVLIFRPSKDWSGPADGS